MIPDIRRVMAGTTEPCDALLVQRVIQPGNPCDVDLGRIEHLLATCNRPAPVDSLAAPGQIGPLAIQVEYFGAERRTGWI